MKYINRELKGTRGYLKKQLIFEIIKTTVMFAMALGLYLIGYCTLKTNKSLWTIFAVLACLPACKSLVGVIMLALYKSPDDETYRKYTNEIGSLPVLYENVLTTQKKSYFVPVMVCRNNTLIGYYNPKKTDDIKNLTEHIQMVLENGGHKGVTVKIFDKEDAFFNRVSQMKAISGEDMLTTGTQAIFTTIKAVSL